MSEDLCGEQHPHPDLAHVFCTKQVPCWDRHYNVDRLDEVEEKTGSKVWPGTERPKASKKDAVRTIADNIKPAETAGPPTWPTNHPPVQANAHSTSIEAADALAPFSSEQRMRVLEAFVEYGDHGRIDQENQFALGIQANEAQTRRKELERGGWVEATEERRLTERERKAIVWRLTAQGRAHLHTLDWSLVGRSCPPAYGAALVLDGLPRRTLVLLDGREVD